MNKEQIMQILRENFPDSDIYVSMNHKRPHRFYLIVGTYTGDINLNVDDINERIEHIKMFS